MLHVSLVDHRWTPNDTDAAVIGVSRCPSVVELEKREACVADALDQQHRCASVFIGGERQADRNGPIVESVLTSVSPLLAPTPSERMTSTRLAIDVRGVRKAYAAHVAVRDLSLQ